MYKFCKLLFAVLFLLNTQAHAESGNSAVTLMYHHFGDSRYPSTNIRLEQFEAHLDYLQKADFQVWPMQKIIDHINDKKTLPTKVVAITMDDAYRSVYTEAYPRLKKLGWPFTVFVSTDYIDKQYSNYMTWEQMREMEKHGASFGNHTRSHDYLIRLNDNETQPQWQQRVKDDLTHAQQRLESELNNVVPIIAYPYGEYNLAVADIAQQLGLVGTGQQSGAIGVLSDQRFLPRFPMAEAFGEIDSFKTKVLSLALPIASTEPTDPSTDETQPLLTVTLANSIQRKQDLNCYVSGQGKVEANWISENQFQVQAKEALPPGRSRYNCTAPSSQTGRFYWFSQPWIRPGGKD